MPLQNDCKVISCDKYFELIEKGVYLDSIISVLGVNTPAEALSRIEEGES